MPGLLGKKPSIYPKAIVRQEDALEMGDPEEQLELLKGEPGAR